ncbi:MAG TPA: WD40 repeat domain-containing protein [Candidatus Methylacidiphilales bacterium]|nr:WD40 repeat domain-containing protein [Candidatus Methylacidiphilales bacterium]
MKRILVLIGCFSLAIVSPHETAFALVKWKQTPLLVYSADGRKIATCTDRGNIRLWDAESGQKFGADIEAPDAAAAFVFSEDGSTLVVASDCPADYSNVKDSLFFSTAMQVTTWSTATGRQINKSPVFNGIGSTECRLGPGGRLFGVTLLNGDVQLWDVAAMKVRGTGVSGLNTRVEWDMLFSPDEKRVLVTGGSGKMLLMDCDSGEVTGNVMLYAEQPPDTFPISIYSYAFSQDGTLVYALGEYHAVLRAWNSKDATPAAIAPSILQYRGSALSPNGRYMLSKDNQGNARLVDLKLDSHKNTVVERQDTDPKESGHRANCISNNGKAMLQDDTGLVVYDFLTGKQRAEIAWNKYFAGESAYAWRIPHLNRTEDWMIVFSRKEKTAVLCNLSSANQQITKINRAGAIAFSPDGRKFAVTTDGTDLKTYECAAAVRELSH